MANTALKRVMVLMLENRSFDHLLGFSDIAGVDGLKGNEFNLLDPADRASQKFVVRHGGNYSVASGKGPGHSLADTNTQLFGIRSLPTPLPSTANSGFVKAYGHNFFDDVHRQATPTELEEVMSCFTPEQIPVVAALAKGFVLCDKWFASVPGPTMPNRAYMHAATSQGWDWNNNFNVNMTAKTIYESLEEAGKSWRVYYHDLNEVMQLYRNVKRTPKTMVPFTDSFAQDVDSGDVADYTVVIPAFLGRGHAVNSMHAPNDIRPGEKLIADVYAALRSNKDIWESTLLIVLFDEHGGYYDHVPPPTNVPNPDGLNSESQPNPGHPRAEPFPTPFDFTRLGLRVPAILISPWLPAQIDHDQYEHASIPATLKEIFGLKSFLTKRDAAAGRFSKWFTASSSLRTDTPELAVPMERNLLDDMQREILRGSIALDPNPQNHDPARVMDINDQQNAHDFVRRMASRHIEHCMANKGYPRYKAKLETAPTATIEAQPSSTAISVARARSYLAKSN